MVTKFKPGDLVRRKIGGYGRYKEGETFIVHDVDTGGVKPEDEDDSYGRHDPRNLELVSHSELITNNYPLW